MTKPSTDWTRVKQIVADSLKENVDTFKTSRENFYKTYYSKAEYYTSYSYALYQSIPYYAHSVVRNDLKDKIENYDYVCACVKIQTKSGVYYRKIFFPYVEFSEIRNAVLSDSKFEKRVLTLPEPVKNSITINDDSVYDNSALEIYNLMNQELKSVESTKWLDETYTNRVYTLFISYIAVFENKMISIHAPLRPDLTPNAYAKFMELTYNTGKSDRETIASMLKSGEYKNYDCVMYLMLKDTPNGALKEYNCKVNSEIVNYLLEKNIEEKISVDNSCVSINITNNNHRAGEIVNYIGYFNLGNLTYEDIKNAGLGDRFNKLN